MLLCALTDATITAVRAVPNELTLLSFDGAGLPYAHYDGNSTVRATNVDRAPLLS